MDDFDKVLAGEKSMGSRMLEKHGPWAFGCLVLGSAFYMFALQPMQKDRDIFIKTILDNNAHQSVVADENITTMKKIAESSDAIEASVMAQENTLDRIGQEIESQTELRKTAMKTMTAFAEKVQSEHPEMDRKLDELINQKENGAN